MPASPTEPSATPIILRVAVPSPLRRQFDYLLPADLPARITTPLQPGIRVRVPFGKRELTGILLETTTSSQIDSHRLKPALAILEEKPLFPPHLLDLWLWAARYYQHPIGDALHTMLPAGLRATSAATIRRRKSDTDSANPTQTHDHPDRTGTLSSEQILACQAIKDAGGRFSCFLLDGVTGSGKTEVYLQAIADTLLRSRQVLVLVPEIGLTPQTLARFRQRFTHRIVVLHSGLTPRQRLNAWLEAASGEADIVIGTRSAIFTPLARPGLIVIDEEHDGSFKQQDGFRYSARDLGVMRGQAESVPVVLGSATPSLETLHNALSGRYRHLRLTQRPGTVHMPAYRLIDTSCQTLDEGFSAELLQRIGTHIQQGNQVLVFINRRGFAPVLQCRDCGWIAECRNCDARLTLHSRPAHLRCHHCERRDPVPSRCPGCRTGSLTAIGAGSERSELALQRHFPHTRVIRVDSDSTSRKNELSLLLAEIGRGEPCILVGTQMLAKGHHFPSVSLVAVLDADSGLFSADFRGQEFMGQLLTQVAGRAGRAEIAGEVMIQTRHSTHQSLQTLIHQGYHALAETLLQERRVADMPPFSFMALLRAEAVNVDAPEQFLRMARELAGRIRLQLPVPERVIISGPLPAPMEKRANRYRQQLLIRSPQRADLQKLLGQLCEELETSSNQRKVRWSVDVDPLDMI